MWLPFALLLIIGAALADHDHAWETGHEYFYDVHSRTLTNLGELTEEYAGILMKASLTVQATSTDTLQAVISKPQYARVHQELPDGCTTRIPMKKLKYHELPMSGKPFTIKMKHGLIRDLLVENDVPIWELNILKSIVSQLQVDTQGENRMKSKSIQVPDDKLPFAMFRAMEDSVGGKCEVLYDITPLSIPALNENPELVPLPDLRGDGIHMDIMKTKNYSRCEQRMGYHFGIAGRKKWSPISNHGYISRSSTSRIIISGNLQHFIIQSSVTMDKISVNQKMYTGTVYAGTNVTLSTKLDKILNPLQVSDHLVSTGNLVYTYNSPFSKNEMHKASPSIGWNSLPVESSESHSSESSSEDAYNKKDPQDSSSSSSDSSSIASSDERSYLHSKPSLDQAPDNPLLPYFIGYKGKAIQNSEEVDAVEAAFYLIKKIPEEIEFARINSLSLGMLEEFTILTKLIRTMDTKQIYELQQKINAMTKELPSSIDDELKQYYIRHFWDMMRDAVAQAGTGPAFMTIKKWINDKYLNGMEAGRIISRLPKTVRTPTAEYIQAFFELIQQPNVMQQRFLNVSAPLAFAELVYYAQISKTHHYNRYPVFAFGRMTPKHDRAVVETYIPYMAKQLKDAIKEGDSPKIQTYIVALGNFGHPKILSIFEPYLEGTVPVSNFQRLLMVFSLRKLAENDPRLVRSVAYKIYLNVIETDDIRATAVFLVLKTNPPLAMMQRMAEFTNRDTSKQVNSAVRTAIESLAKLEGSDHQDLIRKARITKELLKHHEESSDEYHSQAFYKTCTWENLVYKLSLYVLGSGDSDIPKAEFINLGLSHGVFNLPDNEAGYMVSSIKQLLDIWDMLENDDEEHKPSAVEKIARALKILPETPQQLEGNVYVDNIYASMFYPYDNHTIERLVDMLTTNFVKAMEPGQMKMKNINHMESYDVTIGFPTETGLPFIYTMEAPRLVRISGEGKLNIKPLEGFTTNLNIAGHLALADNLQNRIGFVAPFEHHQYIAGVDDNTQLFVPIGFEAKFEPAQKSIQVTIHPHNYYKYGLEMIMLATSTIPYTSSYDILKLQPVLLDKGTHNAYIRKPQEMQFNLDQLHVYVTSDLIDSDSEESRESQYESKFKMWNELLEDNAHYKMMNIMLKSSSGQVNITFDVVETDANSDADDNEKWPVLPTMADKEPDSAARRQQFLKEVSKGINSATSTVVDIDAYLPAIVRERQILTFAYSESNVDDKSRYLFFWRETPRWIDEEKGNKMEICSAGMIRSARDILLDPEKAMKRVPKDEYFMEFQIGESCEEADALKIRIEGNDTRSDDFIETIMDSEVVQKCRHEMEHGNQALKACQEAVALAHWKDHSMMSVDINSEFLNGLINKLIQFVSQKVLSEESIEIVNPKNAGRKTIDMEMKISPDLEIAEVTLHTSEMDITFDPFHYSEKALSSIEKKINELMEEEEDDRVSCTLDKTKALTFDDKTYPIELGKCWYAMMTTYPQANPDNPHDLLPIPEEMQVAVLVRETEDGHRQVRMIMGDKEIEMQKSGDHLEATVNGEKVHCSEHKSHRVQEDDETIIEIFTLPDGSIRILSEQYEVNAVFDGERIMLEVSDEYRSAIRGLCGTYDTRPDTDFTCPMDCILTKPADFVASYALTHENCEDSVKEKQKHTYAGKCIQMQHNIQSNVISDREAGRPWTENKKWGYHHEQHNHNAQGKRCTHYRTKIMEEGDEICFTTRPLPICGEGCKPTEMKTKTFALHCMPKTESTMHLKKRIEKGANPDMTQRTVSKSHSYEVPLSCSAV